MSVPETEHGAVPLAAAVQAGLRGTGVASSVGGGGQRLMDAYRSGEVPDSPVLASGRDAAAYAAYRMPATVAATAAAWAQLRLALPGWAPAQRAGLRGRNGGCLVGSRRRPRRGQAHSAGAIGRCHPARPGDPGGGRVRVAAGGAWRSWRLDAADSQDPAPGRSDLAVSAYVLGELSQPQQERLVGLAIQAAPVVLLVEPGTPAGPPADPGRAGPAARGWLRHRGTVPASARLPAGGRGGLVPLRRPGAAFGPAPAGQGCGTAVRGREVQLRGGRRADRPGTGLADWPGGPAAAAAQGPGPLDLCAADGRSAQLPVGKSKGERTAGRGRPSGAIGGMG